MATLRLPLHRFPASASCLNPKTEPGLKNSFLLPVRFRLRRTSQPLRCPGAPRCMSVDVDSESVNVKSESIATDSQPAKEPRDPRREELFAVLNTGKWGCRSCGYVYDEFTGDSSYPIAAGTEFGKLPEDWRCPTCGAAKAYFNSKSMEVAGFAENQKFGFGTNSLTSGQKSILIYGSLLVAFLLFLSGYFLQ